MDLNIYCYNFNLLSFTCYNLSLFNLKLIENLHLLRFYQEFNNRVMQFLGKMRSLFLQKTVDSIFSQMGAVVYLKLERTHKRH